MDNCQKGVCESHDTVTSLHCHESLSYAANVQNPLEVSREWETQSLHASSEAGGHCDGKTAEQIMLSICETS